MTATIITIILCLFFPIAFAYRNHFQMLERDATSERMRKRFNRKWHSWQFWIQIAFYGVAAASVGWALALFMALHFWILFDGITNIFLGKPFFYVGKSAAIDKFFRRRFKNFYRASALVKTSILFGSSVFVVLNLLHIWCPFANLGYCWP